MHTKSLTVPREVAKAKPWVWFAYSRLSTMYPSLSKADILPLVREVAMELIDIMPHMKTWQHQKAIVLLMITHKVEEGRCEVLCKQLELAQQRYLQSSEMLTEVRVKTGGVPKPDDSYCSQR